jgi:hypothetical protein
MKPIEDTMTPGATQQGSELATDNTAIRPFRVNVPEAEFTELRRRVTTTEKSWETSSWQLRKSQ